MGTVSPEFKKLGRRIKLLRQSRGMTQGELAEKLGISQNVISNVERGYMRTTLKRLFQMRDIFGCTMNDFFDEEGKEEKINVEEIVEAMRLVKKLKLASASEK